MKLVPIEQVLTNRTLEPGDDISDLAKNIQDSGPRVPILVDAEYRLIDGLRRLEAMRQLGFTQVEVTATTMYPVACASLKRAREHGAYAVPLKPSRIWQIYNAMQPLLWATKTHYMTGRRKGTGSKGSAGGRPMFVEAMGLGNESALQALVQVHRAAENPNHPLHERALVARDMMEKGELGLYGGVNYMKNDKSLRGSITKYQEQKELLHSAAAAIRGLLRGLTEMGPLDPKYPADEVQAAVKELAALRAQLTKFLKKINEENKKND